MLLLDLVVSYGHFFYFYFLLFIPHSKSPWRVKITHFMTDFRIQMPTQTTGQVYNLCRSSQCMIALNPNYWTLFSVCELYTLHINVILYYKGDTMYILFPWKTPLERLYTRRECKWEFVRISRREKCDFLFIIK